MQILENAYPVSQHVKYFDGGPKMLRLKDQSINIQDNLVIFVTKEFYRNIYYYYCPSVWIGDVFMVTRKFEDYDTQKKSDYWTKRATID